MSKHLFNKESKESLRLKLEAEVFKRITLSFYRYVIIENPDDFRNEVYEKFESLGILGRVYVANEGINAQISVPEHNFNSFKDFLQDSTLLCDMPLKIAVEDNGKSFIKLIVKVKTK